MGLNVNNIKITEYNIQHIAHIKLSEKYKTIIGEVKVSRKNGRGARFDLVVFDDITGDALFTVEVKRSSVAEHSKKDYYEFMAGVPNYLIAGEKQALDAVNVIKRQMENI